MFCLSHSSIGANTVERRRAANIRLQDPQDWALLVKSIDPLALKANFDGCTCDQFIFTAEAVALYGVQVVETHGLPTL